VRSAGVNIGVCHSAPHDGPAPLCWGKSSGRVKRLAGEQRLLGQPVSVHPLALLTPDETQTSLRALPETAGKRVTVRDVRLPEWTAAPGFYLAGEETFVRTQSDGPTPAAWHLTQLAARWRTDAWAGAGWRSRQVATEAPDNWCVLS
jgi:hypothetical protein